MRIIISRYIHDVIVANIILENILYVVNLVNYYNWKIGGQINFGPPANFDCLR